MCRRLQGADHVRAFRRIGLVNAYVLKWRLLSLFEIVVLKAIAGNVITTKRVWMIHTFVYHWEIPSGFPGNFSFHYLETIYRPLFVSQPYPALPSPTSLERSYLAALSFKTLFTVVYQIFWLLIHNAEECIESWSTISQYSRYEIIKENFLGEFTKSECLFVMSHIVGVPRG